MIVILSRDVSLSSVVIMPCCHTDNVLRGVSAHFQLYFTVNHGCFAISIGYLWALSEISKQWQKRGQCQSHQ